MVGSPSYEGLRFAPHSVGRGYRNFVLITYWFLVVVGANIFLSDSHHVLRAECVLGCGVEVACGIEVLG